MINGWSQNQKFGAPHGCLVGKYKVFGEKISALAWNKPPKPFRARFENTMGNPIFNFFVCWSKRSKKKFTIEIWTFSFQNCFQNQFWTSGSGQTENTQIRICVFSVWPLPEVESLFRKQIWNENVHISILNLVLKSFGPYEMDGQTKCHING